MHRIVVLIAFLLSLPLVGLFIPFFSTQDGSVSADLGAQGTLLHLWRFVLADYLVSTFVLLLGVGVGIFVLGVGNAWLVANYQFPGSEYLNGP